MYCSIVSLASQTRKERPRGRLDDGSPSQKGRKGRGGGKLVAATEGRISPAPPAPSSSTLRGAGCEDRRGGTGPANWLRKRASSVRFQAEEAQGPGLPPYSVPPGPVAATTRGAAGVGTFAPSCRGRLHVFRASPFPLRVTAPAGRASTPAAAAGPGT